MSDQDKIKLILENLEAVAAKLRAKVGTAATRDCVQDCADLYDSCLANATSDLEKAACASEFNKCMASCPAE